MDPVYQYGNLYQLFVLPCDKRSEMTLWDEETYGRIYEAEDRTILIKINNVNLLQYTIPSVQCVKLLVFDNCEMLKMGPSRFSDDNAKVTFTRLFTLLVDAILSKSR